MGPGCRLLIRDDGSSDATPSLIGQYAAREDGRVAVLEDGKGNLGARGSYTVLLEHADADYVAFCDQDDVWLPERISKPLDRIRAVERELGPDTPILVHTDLVVVDEQLATLAPSFWAYARINPRQGESLNRLLVENVVTGCATMFNRALARLAHPIPGEALMHDWWLALVATALGRLECLPQRTVLYRQHGGNRVGARRRGWLYALRSALTMLDRSRWARHLHDTGQQAEVLLQRFGAELSPQQRSMVRTFSDLDKSGFLKRRQMLVRYQLYRTDWMRNLGWLAMI